MVKVFTVTELTLVSVWQPGGLPLKHKANRGCRGAEQWSQTLAFSLYPQHDCRFFV